MSSPSQTPTPAPSTQKVAGPEGPQGPASYVVGNVELGEYLFNQNCEQCHGSQGKDRVPNPGSSDGMVPSLNPIRSKLFNEEQGICLPSFPAVKTLFFYARGVLLMRGLDCILGFADLMTFCFPSGVHQ